MSKFKQSALWVFTVSIVLLAVLLLVARFIVTQVPSYKSNLERYLSEEIGAQVVISDISASIIGFQPQISLAGVTLDEFKKKTHTLSIDEIRLSFNPMSFLMEGINPNKIIITGVDISFKRFADGHLSIVGLSNNKKGSSGDFSWLLGDGRFEIIDSRITWQDEMQGMPNITLSQANILFQNSAGAQELKMRANLPKDTGGSIVLYLKAKGDVLSDTDWAAKGYFSAKNINVSSHLSRLKLDGFSIIEGVGDVELWSTWTNAKLVQVKGNVQVAEAGLIKSENELKVESLTAQFDWESIRDGWRFQTQDFSFKAEGVIQKKSAFGLQYQTKNSGSYELQATADRLNLNAISKVLQHSDMLDNDVIGLLSDVQAKGILNKANLSVSRDGKQVEWTACGELNDFSSQSFWRVPKMKNISATGCSTQDNGWANLKADNGSVYFKTLFRDPIVISKLEGLLTWEHKPTGWSVNAEHISLDSPHITSQTRLNIQLPADGASPIIDMQSNFGRAEGRFMPLYLPAGVMSDELVNWLDNAFIEGDVKSCSLLLKGTLSDFPYSQGQGTFQVLFGTENAILHYADSWPNVLGASADVEFKNGRVNIIGHTGLISGNKIETILIESASLEKGSYLNLDGKIEGDIKGLYTFFNQSPIKERVSSLLDYSTVSGQAVIDLNIQIPLTTELDTRVAARVTLNSVSLDFPDLDLGIDQIQGVINYDELGLRGQSLKGRVLGEQISVDISPKSDSTVIFGKGRLQITNLANKYPSDFWEKIKGNSAAHITVELPHSGLTGKGKSTVTLESNLDGIAVELPSPIGKAEKSHLPLNMMVTLGGGTLPVQASYGDFLKGSMVFVENESKKLVLEKGDIYLGKAASSLPESKGVRLFAKVDELDVSAWQDALNFEQNNSMRSLLVNQFNVDIGRLKWGDSAFNNVHLTGKNEESFWSGEINSSIVLGRYKVPSNLELGGKIDLDLETLTLPSYDDLELGGKKSPLSPNDIPNIDVKSKVLFIGETKLGALELKLRQKDNGVAIKAFTVMSKRDEFKASGAWEIKEGQNRTALNGSLRSKSLGSLLKGTGISSKLKGTSSDIRFDLYWPGEPQAFSKNRLSGSVDIKSKQGRLLDVEPGIGRIFGLLSLSTLQRRLQLDFSDLVQKGLSFDKIKGHFLMTNGEAQTDQFYLESPSARLDFQGRIGLANEDIDQLITVTPNTTESLPIAGALAGGPLVGAAIFIVQKIAGKTVNKLVGYQYKVSGSWSDPKVKQISKPGGKVFGMVDDILSPFFGVKTDHLPSKDAISK